MSLDFVGAFSAQRSQVFSREELVGFLMSWRGGACSTGPALGPPGTGPAGRGLQAELAAGDEPCERSGAPRRSAGVQERLVADVGKHCPSVTVQYPQRC